MTLEDLYSSTRLATLGDVCAVGDIHPRDAREWAAEHGVSFIRGEYVFTFEEAQEMLEELSEADDEDEEELEPDEDEDDEDSQDEDSDDEYEPEDEEDADA